MLRILLPLGAALLIAVLDWKRLKARLVRQAGPVLHPGMRRHDIASADGGFRTRSRVHRSAKPLPPFQTENPKLVALRQLQVSEALPNQGRIRRYAKEVTSLRKPELGKQIAPAFGHALRG